MASYYRNVFLEFLINNHSSQIDAMTFVIFDKNDADGWIENKDLISLFHIKEPRTYYKELSFNDLYNTIVEDFLELRTTEVLEVDKIKLEFTEDAIEEIAMLAERENETAENIGARRLQTILEKLIEDISFNADGSFPETKVKIDKVYVDNTFKSTLKKFDLNKFVL